MNIIKRNGTEVKFDSNKISIALKKANLSVEEKYRITDIQINEMTSRISDSILNSQRIHNVEEIQDMVEKELFDLDKFELVKNYITYRYHHALDRNESIFDSKILSIINTNNTEIQEENANKNQTINSTQRDYVAGEVSKRICQKYIYPQEITDAHNEGLIHLHK